MIGRLVSSAALLAVALGASAETAAPSARARADARHVAVEEAGRRSNDLRLRVLFSHRITDADPAAADDATPLAALIESARGSTDPLVLQLLLDRCRATSSSCDRVELARRWVAVDAQNVVPWIELAAVLDETGDRDGADVAWLRASLASTFRDPADVVARVVWSQVADAADPRVRHLDLVYAIGVAAAVPQRWMTDARTGCRRETRHAACAAVADVAFRDAQSVADVQFARLLTAQADGPRWLRDSRRQVEEALQWGRSQALPDDDAAVVDALDDEAVARLDRILQTLIEKGDVVLAKDELRTRRVSDAEGSRLYALDMAALMRRLHPD